MRQMSYKARLWGVCGRKRRYPSRTEADEEASRMITDGVADPSQCIVYMCNYCLGFHVGHYRCSQRSHAQPKDMGRMVLVTLFPVRGDHEQKSIQEA